MKLIVVAIIASILLLQFVSLTSASGCGCEPCGPGGAACKGCPERDHLCQELIKAVSDIRVRVLQCVCGVPKWDL